MLYTNRSLEFSKDKRGQKVLELNSMYGNFISLQVDRNMNEEIKYIENKFHKHISLIEFVNGKFRITEEDSDDLYLIIDTLGYAAFNKDGKITMKDNNFIIKKEFNNKNRSGKFGWKIYIIKVMRTDKPSLLKYKNTCGETFIVVYDNGRLHHYNQNSFKYSPYCKLK